MTPLRNVTDDLLNTWEKSISGYDPMFIIILRRAIQFICVIALPLSRDCWILGMMLQIFPLTTYSVRIFIGWQFSVFSVGWICFPFSAKDLAAHSLENLKGSLVTSCGPKCTVYKFYVGRRQMQLDVLSRWNWRLADNKISTIILWALHCINCGEGD